MRIFKNKFDQFEFRTFYIQDPVEAKKLVSKFNPKELAGLDIETAKLLQYKTHPMAGLCPHLSKIRLIQIYDGQNAYVFDMFHIPLSVLEPYLRKGMFIAHNALFEGMFFTKAGIPQMNINCSMIMSQMLEGADHSPFEVELLPGEEEEDDTDRNGLSRYRKVSHSLDALISRLFGVKVSKQQQVSDWGKPELDTEQITYAGLDAVLTYHAAKHKDMAPKIAKYGMQKAYKLLKDMQHVVAEMQLEGLPVDWEYHEKMIEDWTEKSLLAQANCRPYFKDVNMRSGKQMSAWLVDYLKDDPARLADWPKTPKDAYAFSRTAIADKSDLPAIKYLLEYKKWAKLIDTYGESLIDKLHPITRRLHTSYTLGETRTGRLSSRKPNCQNYPRDTEFRNMFTAEKDHVLVVSDFSQIELRLQAEFSKDPAMQEVYEKGEDIYCTLASMYFGKKVTKKDKDERMFGKVVMLALGYGMGPTKLGKYARNSYGLNKPQSAWEKAHKTYHNTFNVYSKWCEKMRDRAAKKGYIETLLGKRRKLVDDEMYTRAPNTVIQGSAAELMMRAMLICQERIKGLGKIVATVHDEILLHVHKKHAEKAKTVLAESMNDAMKEMFPNAASCEVADAAYAVRWGEAKGEL